MLRLPGPSGRTIERRYPIIAVDFDDTVATNSSWQVIGEPMEGAIEALKELQAAGCKIIIWTCRPEGGPQEVALEWLEAQGFTPDAINDHAEPIFLPDQKKMRKVFANLYLDDRSFPPFPGWAEFMKWFRENWTPNYEFEDEKKAKEEAE